MQISSIPKRCINMVNKDLYHLNFEDDKLWQKAVGEFSQYDMLREYYSNYQMYFRQFTEFSALKWPKPLWMVLIHVSGKLALSNFSVFLVS